MSLTNKETSFHINLMHLKDGKLEHNSGTIQFQSIQDKYLLKFKGEKVVK